MSNIPDELQAKLDRFKEFVKTVSRNQETIAEYEDISWFKIQALAYVLLIPQKDNLDLVVKEMQKKLDFNDEHLPKFQRYLEFFVEYITGNPCKNPNAPSKPDPNPSAQGNPSANYEDQLSKIMAQMK